MPGSLTTPGRPGLALSRRTCCLPLVHGVGTQNETLSRSMVGLCAPCQRFAEPCRLCA